MNVMEKSPKIQQVSWGHLQIEDGNSYKDAKLWPGDSRSWDWNETGTKHSPGVQPADVKELVDNGAKIIILSRGMAKRLRIQNSTLEWLEEQGIETHVLPTKRAVSQYNDLAESESVGALIHSTC